MRATLIGSSLALIFVIGCGGPKPPPGLVPVKGKITLKGAPLSSGTLNFVSVDGKQTFSSAIKSGQYELALSPTAHGARPGDYKVSIASWASQPTMDKEGKPVEGKPAIHKKYFEIKTSELTAKVPEKGGHIDFDLKEGP